MNIMNKNRITTLFNEKRKKGEKALILFLTAGYPDRATFEQIVPILEESGCDILEVGVPFSDPIADGPTIQRSSEHVLKQGVNLKEIIEMLRRLRKHVSMPFVLFSSINPLVKYGLDKLIPAAREAGVDGILCPDLPPEEATDLLQLCQKYSMSIIFLIAPTTQPERRRYIAEHTRGFIYYVSLKGVTGARKSMSADLAVRIKDLKAISELPVVVGFGISSKEHTHTVALAGADGAVVGSALINLIDQNSTSPDLMDTIRVYIAELRQGLDT